MEFAKEIMVSQGGNLTLFLFHNLGNGITGAANKPWMISFVTAFSQVTTVSMSPESNINI